MTECPTCRYPHDGPHCPNPGCYANPSVTQAQKDIWDARRAKEAAEEAERERIRQIRRRMM